jgi:hypothetical protein
MGDLLLDRLYFGEAPVSFGPGTDFPKLTPDILRTVFYAELPNRASGTWRVNVTQNTIARDMRGWLTECSIDRMRLLISMITPMDCF